MADAVATAVLVKSNHKSGFVFSSKSDGTGESAVTKIDISTLPGAPSRVKLTRLSWAISEGMGVSIAFDRTVGGDPVVHLNGRGFLSAAQMGPIEDKGTGLTGDVKFTTYGHAANKGYTVEVEVENVE